MTSIEFAAVIASTVLIKGSVIVVLTLLVARLVARSASGASLTLGLGLGALGLVLIGPLLPAVGSGFVTIGHDAVQVLRIGTRSLSPPLLLLVIWTLGALVMLGRFFNDLCAAQALARRADGQTGS